MPWLQPSVLSGIVQVVSSWAGSTVSILPGFFVVSCFFYLSSSPPRGFSCVCVCVCAGARRRFYAHLESGYARTWRRLDTAGRRAIRQRFDSYFQDRSPPRIPSYTYSWYSYYRAVIARRECSEPLGAFGRLGSELKRKRILIVIGFSCFFLRRGNKSFCVCVCRTPAGAFSMDWALFPLLGSARFSAFAVSDWDFLYFVFFRGCRPFQWRSTQP